MGRGETVTASITSSNEVQFGFPYGGRQHAWLHIRKHPRYGRDVILTIERSQFICRIGGCSVLVRFDDGQTARYSASEPADHSNNTLFITPFGRFTSNLAKAKRLRIEAQFYQEGARVLEFDVSGFRADDFLPKPKPKPTAPVASKAKAGAPVLAEPVIAAPTESRLAEPDDSLEAFKAQLRAPQEYCAARGGDEIARTICEQKFYWCRSNQAGEFAACMERP